MLHQLVDGNLDPKNMPAPVVHSKIDLANRWCETKFTLELKRLL